MSTGMMTNEANRLQSLRPATSTQPAVLRIPATIISYIFHPVFIPMYVIYFLAYIHPNLYTGFDYRLKNTAVMGAALMAYTVFPLVTVFLLKGLNFIDSIYLRTQRDRVIPFIACMMWYFWIAHVWNKFGQTRAAVDMPPEAVQFAIAVFLSSFLGLMVNIRMKVSLHAIAVGIASAFFIRMAFTQDLNFGMWLVVVFLITGLVCSARFIVSDHTAKEIYGGLVTGVLSLLGGVAIHGWLNP